MADTDYPSPAATSHVAGEVEDEYWPPRVELRQFDPNAPRSAYELECLMDAWLILQRSAVDAAVLSAPDRNLFTFSEACIYFATIHDSDFEAKDSKRKKKNKESKKEDEREQPETNVEANVESLRLFSEHLLEIENGIQEPVAAFNGAAGSSTHNALASDEQDVDMDPLVRHHDVAPEDRDARDLRLEASSIEPWHEQGLQIDTQNLPIPSDTGDEALTNTSENQQAYPTSSATHSALDDVLRRTGPFDFPPAAVPNQYTESTPKVNPKKPKSDFIGIVYLVPANSPAQEVSIGLTLLPHARGQGFGSVTIQRVLATAFNIFEVHRVSAGVLGPSPIVARRPFASMKKMPGGGNALSKETATSRPDVEARLKVSGTDTDTEAGLRMFVGLGFSLEGTARRAVPDMHDNGSWRDAHYLAMLDTDWLAQQRATLTASVKDQAQNKGKGKSTSMDSESDEAPESCNGKSKAERAKNAWKDQCQTRWDEMLTRHQREQETLARVEARLQRSASLETLRPTCGRDELVENEIGLESVTDGATSGYSSSVAGDGELEGKKVGETEREAFVVASPAPRSPTSTSAYSSNDPIKDFNMARHRASGARDGSRYFSDDGSESEVDYGEETVQSKVARFLRVRPAPGTPPPPSDVEDDSEFESCMDELDLLSDRETSAPLGTGMVPRSMNENLEVMEGENEETTGPLATSSNSISPLNLRKKQSRKRRRLSNDLVAVEDSGHANTSDASSSGSIPPHSSNASLNPWPFAFARSGTDIAHAGTTQLQTTARTRAHGASPNSDFQFIDADSDMDMDSHSDAETAITVTSTSTWEVVSGGSAASGANARMPTPLTSLRALSNGARLLSLRSASDNGDE